MPWSAGSPLGAPRLRSRSATTSRPPMTSSPPSCVTCCWRSTSGRAPSSAWCLRANRAGAGTPARSEGGLWPPPACRRTAAAAGGGPRMRLSWSRVLAALAEGEAAVLWQFRCVHGLGHVGGTRPDSRGDVADLAVVEVEHAQCVLAEDLAGLLLGDVVERVAHRQGGVRPRALLVGVIGAPHEVVDADLVAERDFERCQEAAADEAVLVPVLRR